LIDLGIAAAFSIAISIAKESIAASIGLKQHIAVAIGAYRQFPKSEAGYPGE
jgi:hypothetical protein